MSSRKHNGVNRSRKTTAAWTFAMVLVTGLCGTAGINTAQAQSTSGSMFGQGPAGATVDVHGTTGTHRHTTIKDNGRYTLRSLPISVYTVTLEQDGKTLDKRTNIPISPGRGAEVDFACPQDTCAKQ